MGLFSTASLCCGLSANIYVLVKLRFMQALGGAGFTPSATGVIVDHFGPAHDKVVGLFGSIFSIGAMIGPIFGGLFVTYWTWRGIFFANVPIGVLLIVLCLKFIPADRPRVRGRGKHFDYLGMAELGIGVLGVMLAFNALSAGMQALRGAEFLAPAAAAVLALALFARHTARSAQPFISGRFIAGRGFGATNIVNVVYGGMVAGLIALVPLYATTRYGIPALGSGTLLTAEGATVIIMSSVGALVLRRTGYRLPIYVGAVVMASGCSACPRRLTVSRPTPGSRSRRPSSASVPAGPRPPAATRGCSSRPRPRPRSRRCAA
ncbi:MAG: MFS transporter [Rhodanobacteraceae bacterium]